MRATAVRIDLVALRHNLQRVRQCAPSSRIMAAVKADGYGHGSGVVAMALQEAGVDALGVACLDEAQVLRAQGVTIPITLLEGVYHSDELTAAASLGLELVLHHEAQLDMLEEVAPEVSLGVWIKIDTGMHRLGFAPQQLADVLKRLQRLSHCHLLGLMTHLACADELDSPATEQQLRLFSGVVEGQPGERSIANSAGILGWPASHAEWVRPGIMLYGGTPFADRDGPVDGLQPVMTFHSELIAIKQLQAGDCVGYGATWCAPEAMSIGVVAAGYGDGYPRHAPSGTPVLVNGQEVPLLGRVSMDMITVDLRSQPQARVGDPVVLWGEGLAIERVARPVGTISYELFCSITARVRREVVG